MKSRSVLNPFVVVTMLIASACASAPEPDCLGPADCVDAESAMCPACPAPYVQICANGNCVKSNESKLAVRADIALHFSLTGDVASVIFAFVDPRSAGADKNLTCSDIGSGKQAIDTTYNVVAAGFVNFQSTSGTALFPDANFGEVSSGEYLLVVRGFSQARGEGDLVAAACLDQVAIEGSDPVKLTVSLRPAG